MSKVDSIKIHAVAACCKNYGIGVNGDLPWNLPKEYKHFQAVTRGNPPEGKQNAVVMGRATWFSIPEKYRPLRNRINIVMSRKMKLADFEGQQPDAVVSSLEQLIALLSSEQFSSKVHDVFNVGGSTLYNEIIQSPYSGYIYLTRVSGDYKCDTFFPNVDEDASFHKLPITDFPTLPQDVTNEKGVDWHVEVYKKMSQV